MSILKPTADFFGAIFIPLFKVAGVVFLIVIVIMGTVILWQRAREKREYRNYLGQ